jgi:hypothetical protein
MSAQNGRLSALAVDIQVSVLAFLAPLDLASFSTVSRECHNVGAIDRLWNSLLTRHFTDVLSSLSLSSKFKAIRLSRPAQKFWALASLPCSV